ncbi:MAG: tetratricopeptide repeat protein [Anaerolineaceae bacterium]|nr:tetratricopeptide repeat protein [Anaerolineaceae bacterium]
MPPNNIIDVSETDFEFEVLNYSQNRPVVVDFWATWCVPCKVLGPLLERLAEEGRGSFRLARVDVDANPNLALHYGVRSIPTVKAFTNRQVVAEFSGALPEPRVREFIKKLAPSESDLTLEKAGSLLQQHQWSSAEKIYRQVLEEASDNAIALLGLAKALLAQGRYEEARRILRNFPASHEYTTAESLLPLADAYAWLESQPSTEMDPLAPAYFNSLRLASRGNIPSALDGLLDILKQEKRYRNGQARMVFLALLELLGAQDPLARQYRSELASVLF